MNLIDLQSIPEIGSVLMVGNQPFTVAAIESYQRVDGSPSAVITWSAPCPECDRPFEIKTGMVCRWPNRRCPDHHHKGKPVVIGHDPRSSERSA